VDLKEIRNLVDLMKKNGIAVFKLERENFKITLKTNEAGQSVVQSVAAPASLPAIEAPDPSAKAPVPASSLKEILSPMVGTFYNRPAPEAPPFVSEGQSISADSVVCIVEAMKVMNEVKAEVSGTVVEICAENGKPVQFGQVLFRVQ